MRKLEKVFIPTAFLVGITAFWLYFVVIYGIQNIMNSLSSGLIVSAAVSVIVIILVTYYYVFDILVPVIQQIRSSK